MRLVQNPGQVIDLPVDPPTTPPRPHVVPNQRGGVNITITDPLQLDAALGTSGIDQLFYGGSAPVILPGTIENLALTAGEASGKGNALRNALTGSAGKNLLQGLGGNDTINGGSGNDTLYGNSGRDAFVFSTKLGTSKTGCVANSERGRERSDRVIADSGSEPSELLCK